MMKYIVAVSGGVDSVVLLDLLVKRYNPDSLIVAHFEHGIRGEDSDFDARFVEKLSQKYKLKFEIAYGKLSKNASEAEARARRYEFLRAVAKKHQAQIVTAHHVDDLVETVAINLARGTGWRGLAVLAADDIWRPLLGLRKRDIYKYAVDNQLEYVEDATNQTDAYLRNRLRRRTGQLSLRVIAEITKLRHKQCELSLLIHQELDKFQSISDRYFLIMVNDTVAQEILRQQTNGELTLPQLEVAVHGIKTLASGKKLQLGAGWELRVFQKTYTVKKLQR